MRLDVAEMTTPLADLPAPIIAMLRDEANLVTARHVLEDARHDCLSRQETIEAKRPALGFLGSKKHRDEYTAAVATVSAQLRMVDNMLTRANAARERLQPPLRTALAEYLTQTDPPYRKGLRAGRFHEHWRRAHAVVSDRLKAFLRDAREARNAIASDVERGRARHSSDGTWKLGIAHTAAAELDREVESLNRLVQEHGAAVTDTPFSEIHLPSLEPWNCVTKTDLIMMAAPSDALVEMEKLLSDFTEYRQPSLDTLKSMFTATAGEHAQKAEKHLRERWSQFLTYAEAHLVSDAELEPTLADIERRQIEVERARVTAQLAINKPFSLER